MKKNHCISLGIANETRVLDMIVQYYNINIIYILSIS